MLVRKHRAGTDRVHRLTVATPMPDEVSPAGSPKVPGVLHAGAALGTMQTAWMKILSQPARAKFIVAYVENRKVHV